MCLIDKNFGGAILSRFRVMDNRPDGPGQKAPPPGYRANHDTQFYRIESGGRVFTHPPKINELDTAATATPVLPP